MITPPGSQSSICGAPIQREAPCATGQANSQYLQGLTTALSSSMPIIDPGSISHSASRLSFSCLHSTLSNEPLRKASRGQARWQGISQPLHGSKSSGPVGSNSASMKMPRNRTRVPYSGVTNKLCLPNTPRPAKTAESLRKAPPNSIW